jgi:hypothetical protein
VFPFWEADGSSIYPMARFNRWGLNSGAVRRITRYGPAVYFPGSSANELESADDNPITFASGEPYTLALLIRRLAHAGARLGRAAGAAVRRWPAHQHGRRWQFTGSERLDEAYVPFFGAFGSTWDDAMVARWSANPLGMLWSEMDAAFVASGGGGDPPAAVRRSLIIIAVQ